MANKSLQQTLSTCCARSGLLGLGVGTRNTTILPRLFWSKRYLLDLTNINDDICTLSIVWIVSIYLYWIVKIYQRSLTFRIILIDHKYGISNLM